MLCIVIAWLLNVSWGWLPYLFCPELSKNSRKWICSWILTGDSNICIKQCASMHQICQKYISEKSSRSWRALENLAPKLCFGGWGNLEKIWKSARRSRADFQIFSKLPQPSKHNLGAKFSKARQLRDDFTINTPTLHVHAQSNSDSIFGRRIEAVCSLNRTWPI